MMNLKSNTKVVKKCEIKSDTEEEYNKIFESSNPLPIKIQNGDLHGKR